MSGWPADPLMEHTSVERIALLSVHTSPLDQPGTGDGGGLNVYVRETARRLARRGIHVDVFTRATRPGTTPTVSLAPGVDVHRIEAGPLAPVPKEQLATHLCAFVMAMLRHPTAGTHDVVHANYWLSGWVGRRLADRWDIPFLHTFHTLGVIKNATLAPGDAPEPALRLAAERRIARDADRILVLTCGEAGWLHRNLGVSGTRMTVVPAGVDLEVFGPDPRPDDAEVRALLPAGEGPLLLFVGRLQPLKGPDVAIRTLAALHRTVPSARLLIVGGTSGNGHGRSDPDGLVALARGLGVHDRLRIVPARPQRQVASLYRAADVVVAPSRSETFGLVALEAQASGTPVVAADVPGLQATVGPGGVLVDGHDPERHAAAVAVLLSDPACAAGVGAAGIRHAARSSWERTVDRLVAVYGELAGGRSVVRTAS